MVALKIKKFVMKLQKCFFTEKREKIDCFDQKNNNNNNDNNNQKYVFKIRRHQEVQALEVDLLFDHFLKAYTQLTLFNLSKVLFELQRHLISR